MLWTDFMPADQIVIDANLLVLLVVGAVDRRLVGKHRRVKNFAMEDYDLLLDLLQETPHPVVVTPNTLTEASNLLEDRQDRRLLRQLKEHRGRRRSRCCQFDRFKQPRL